MARAALAALLAAAAVVAAACGDEPRDSTHVRGDRLTIYASVPVDGPSAAAGRAAEQGMRRALADAGGRAGGREVRLVVLPATEPEGLRWDPGVVEANAERAVEDPTTIAYLGELDQGATAVSLPVTNGAGILQVSPADGLTSLTRRLPGRPRAGPERYYPGERASFVRLVPPDVAAARAIVGALRRGGARRVAILHGDRISDRELEGAVVALIGERPPRSVARVTVSDHDQEPQAAAEAVADTVEKVAEGRPDAVVYAGARGAVAERLLGALAERLPGVPVIGGPQLADGGDAVTSPRAAGLGDPPCALTGVPPAERLPPRGRRLLADLRSESGTTVPVEALLGYDAMALALEAIDTGGPDRAEVVSVAKALPRHGGLTGAYAFDRHGDPARPMACVAVP